MQKTVLFFLTLSVSVWITSSAELSATPLGRMVLLSEHVPSAQIAKAQYMGRMNESAIVQLTISLNLRSPEELTHLLSRIYSPGDELYRKFLSTTEFAEKFYPTKSDFEIVQKYISDQGLVVKSQLANTIQISGSVHEIESAFALELHQYQSRDKNGFIHFNFAPNQNPVVRSDVASKISGIAGLSNFSNFVSHEHISSGRSSGIGTGPLGGMAPSDIQKAYSIPVGASAAGQTLALMELDGYKPADIALYASHFGLKATKLKNILLDGASGAAGAGEIEVALDIELMMALAPDASNILVYEGANSNSGVLNLYAKIASDNLAKQVSTSWGSPESQETSSFLNSESASFMQMAAQGQSIYAAAGDGGAYDDQSTLSVDDPSSQLYVTSAGGTTLSLAANGNYKSETSWGVAGPTPAKSQGGGGGISAHWQLPVWQNGLATSRNKGSKTFRMVPDISADANPESGYAVVVDGAFTVVGGTSCVSPILAAVTALVNHARAVNNVAPLGFANPTLYRLYASSKSSDVFNDIADASTNLFYPAVAGYDLSTGLGSMAMQNLFSSLVDPVLPPDVPTNVTLTAVVNP